MIEGAKNLAEFTGQWERLGGSEQDGVNQQELSTNALKGESRMEELANTCAWCGKHVPEDAELFGLGARARAGVDLRDAEGTFIPLPLDLVGRTVHAFVVTSDSEAKRAGNDFMFITCSRKCAESLKAALYREINTFSRVELLH